MAGGGLSRLENAGIAYEVKADAADGKYPWYTFSELRLIHDADYERALKLIEDNSDRRDNLNRYRHRVR